MTQLTISEELLQQLLTASNHKDKIELECIGTATEIAADEMEPDDKLFLSRFYDKASAPQPVTNGSPTMLRLVMWMAHALPVVNSNGVAFVGEELRAAAEKISTTQPLVMDFNHSAVKDNGLPKMIGVWQKAEYAFNPSANKGQGAWGILATGVMAAWLFPEIATSLLADQVRFGHIRGSMACIPGAVEYRDLASDHAYKIAHNPVFVTLSTLDVANADPDANGLGVEGSQDPNLETELREQLLETAEKGATDETNTPAAQAAPVEEPALMAAAQQEDGMNPEQIEAMLAANAELTARIETLSAQIAEMESLRTTNAELTTAREALATEVQTANAEIARLNGELTAASEKLATYTAAEEQAARAELLANRLKALPESYQKAHAAKDAEVREQIESKWLAMSDEQFDFYKTHELLGGFVTAAANGVGYVERSQKEGVLPAAPDETARSIGARIAAAMPSSRK